MQIVSMQIVSGGDNLNDMSKSFSWKNKMSSAEDFIQHAEH